MDGSDPFDSGAIPDEAKIEVTPKMKALWDSEEGAHPYFGHNLRGKRSIGIVIDDFWPDYKAAQRESGVIPQTSLLDEQV